MEQNVAIILSACITASVTIIGFVVTYFLNKRNFKEEVKKQKVNANLEKIADLPYRILALIDKILDKTGQDTVLSEFRGLMATVFAYGSKDAISLAASMQEVNYKYAKESEDVDKNEIIAYYILLLCQVKYDLTEIKINPNYWYRMRLNDYSTMKESLKNATNRIVKELNLLLFLEI